jgi:hypothetical protein
MGIHDTAADADQRDEIDCCDAPGRQACRRRVDRAMPETQPGTLALIPRLRRYARVLLHGDAFPVAVVW